MGICFFSGWGKEENKAPDRGYLLNILVCSAFKNDYAATARSLIGALWLQRKISVSALAADPAIDLKEYGCWLSNTIDDNFIQRGIKIQKPG